MHPHTREAVCFSNNLRKDDSLSKFLSKYMNACGNMPRSAQLWIENVYTIRLQHLESERGNAGPKLNVDRTFLCSRSHTEPLRGAMHNKWQNIHRFPTPSHDTKRMSYCEVMVSQSTGQQHKTRDTKVFFKLHMSTYNTFNTLQELVIDEYIRIFV